MITLLVGCAASGGPGPHDAELRGGKKPAPKSVSKPKKTEPGPEDCGPVLSLKTWKIQCSNASIAMMCRKSDPTDRRCASKRGGKYRWTYGSYCDRALPCYKRACR